MRKWVLPLLLMIIMLLPLGVRAQEPISLSSLHIQIWPEYDRPGVLVIYQLSLADSVTLPASVAVRIPAAAGEPNAVAARQVDGTLYTIDKTRQVAGEWAVISFTTTVPEVQLEYYDPGITKQDAARHYQYTWPGDYAVGELTIQVQQPIGATNMRISPSLGPGTTGDYNLTYYTQNIGAISAGQNIRITVDYEKSSDALSAETVPVQPSAPIPQSAIPDLDVWLPWVLGILGAGLIIGAIVWFWQSGRQKPLPQARRKRSRAAMGERNADSGSTEVGIYCSQCGKRASPGDQFCRSCGTAIRAR